MQSLHRQQNYVLGLKHSTESSERQKVVGKNFMSMSRLSQMRCYLSQQSQNHGITYVLPDPDGFWEAAAALILFFP